MLEIFEHEKDIADIVLASSNFSVASQALAVSQEEKEQILLKDLDKDLVSKAGIEDGDLYFHKAILVTTNWNKNDDIFIPEEVWAAQKTPIHKPTNLNHASSKIVGHITSSWAIEEGGSVIAGETDINNLPEKFHILTGSVIYKKFHNDPDYENVVAKLIEDIEKGEQFVSMECSLKSFDYAIQTAEGSVKIIKRNDETSFLTKHLRKYGGAGIYENAKIGRVLKQISFIGQAYTAKPANPESIIFRVPDLKDVEKNQTSANCSVLSISNLEIEKDNLMSDLIQKQIEDLTKRNESLASEVSDLKAELSKADVEKYVMEIEALKASVLELQDTVAKKDASMKEKEKEAEEYKTKASATEASLKELAEQISQYQVEKITASRVSRLVDGGYAKEDAQEKVKVFASLNDEQFEVFAEQLIDLAMKTKSMKMQEGEVPKKEDPAKSEDVTEALEDASVEVVNLASETVEDAVATEDLVSSLAAKLKSQMASNRNSKGDK
jgi:hypothetical protein